MRVEQVKAVLLSAFLAACYPPPIVPDADLADLSTAVGAVDASVRRRDAITLLPIGDSVTYGTQFTDAGAPLGSSGSYRWPLWQLAAVRGLHITFLGSIIAGPPEMPDGACEGHPGAVVGCFGPDMGDLAHGRYQLCDHFEEWITTYHPDVITIMAGTNEPDQRTWDTAAARLADGIRQHILAIDPSVLVVVLVPPLLGGDTYRTNAIAMLRANLMSTFAPGFDPRVTVVDVGGALTLADLYVDETHPRPEGDAKMAAVLEPALEAFAL